MRRSEEQMKQQETEEVWGQRGRGIWKDENIRY